MIIVSDTTPVISLIKADRLNIFKSLFDEIIIPRAVYNELTNNSVYVKEAEIVKSCEYIVVKDVLDTEAVNSLMYDIGLDHGESEAIILSKELNCDLLIVDEKKARRVAKERGMNLSGTIGLLSLSYDRGIISGAELMGIVDNMKMSGIRISDSLYNLLMNKIK